MAVAVPAPNQVLADFVCAVQPGAADGVARDGDSVLFSTTAQGDELASATRAQRNAWLDERLRALSAEDRAVLARAAALLSSIADS